jgi:hypothetical protein
MILRRTSALLTGFAWSGWLAGGLTSSRWARWNMLPLFFFSSAAATKNSGYFTLIELGFGGWSVLQGCMLCSASPTIGW